MQRGTGRDDCEPDPPGVGTVDDIRAVHDLGVGLLRVATHASEADISAEHLGAARELGMATAGFLVMSHTLEPAALAAQARVMADNGCECVYVVDSAGAMVLDEVTTRVVALVQEIGRDAQVGFHAHRNLGVGEANTILAVRSGCSSDRRLAAGVRGRVGQRPDRGGSPPSSNARACGPA